MKRKTRWLVYLLALMLVSAGLWADRTDTFDVRAVTKDEIMELSIINLLDADGMPTGNLVAHVRYQLIDSTGAIYAPSQGLRLTLTQGNEATLNGFYNSVVLPQINAAEGL